MVGTSHVPSDENQINRLEELGVNESKRIQVFISLGRVVEVQEGLQKAQHESRPNAPDLGKVRPWSIHGDRKSFDPCLVKLVTR